MAVYVQSPHWSYGIGQEKSNGILRHSPFFIHSRGSLRHYNSGMIDSSKFVTLSLRATLSQGGLLISSEFDNRTGIYKCFQAKQNLVFPGHVEFRSCYLDSTVRS